MKNHMKLEIMAISENEGFARSAVAAFALGLNPSISELSDIKTAVSEAVTNSIVHAYKDCKDADNKIVIECETCKDESGGQLHISVIDYGCGIENLDEAMKPFYTTSLPSERAGMGFTIMQAFTSDFQVESLQGQGTKITMTKKIQDVGKEDTDA